MSPLAQTGVVMMIINDLRALVNAGIASVWWRTAVCDSAG